MCGRYASSASPTRQAEEFEVDDIFEGLPGPDYNVAPTVAVPAVFERRVKESGDVRRRLAPLVWGLVPSWAKDPSIGSPEIKTRQGGGGGKAAEAKGVCARGWVLP